MELIKKSLIRALRTFCQSLVVLIGSDYISITDLDWLKILGIATTTALVSFLTCIAGGLPEVSEVNNDNI